jgi:hypothetical protein
MVMIKTGSLYSFIVIITVVSVGTVLSIGTAMNVYAQNTTMPPSTGQPTEGWMTSFDLENCDFASRTTISSWSQDTKLFWEDKKMLRSFN